MKFLRKNLTLTLLPVLFFQLIATDAWSSRRGRTEISREVIREVQQRLTTELRQTQLSATIRQVFETGQLSQLQTTARRLMESRVEPDPAKAVELSARLLAAMLNRAQFPEARSAILAARQLRESGTEANIALARASYEFAANASASGLVTRTSQTAQRDSPAEVVFATLEAIRLAPQFEGTGTRPLTDVINRMNAEYTRQPEGNRSIEAAAEAAVAREKRRDFVENCRR